MTREGDAEVAAAEVEAEGETEEAEGEADSGLLTTLPDLALTTITGRGFTNVDRGRGAPEETGDATEAGAGEVDAASTALLTGGVAVTGTTVLGDCLT